MSKEVYAMINTGVINEKFKDLIDSAKLDTVLENIRTIVFRNSVKFQERLPNSVTNNGIYTYDKFFYDGWHGGWWTGIYYMAYELFGDIRFLKYAELLSSRLYSLIKNNRIYHYEMGFMYMPVCVGDMRFSRTNEAAEVAVLAADYMLEPRGNYRIHNNMDEHVYRYIGGGDDNIRNNDYTAGSGLNNSIFRLAGKVSGNSKYIEEADFRDDIYFFKAIQNNGECHMHNIYSEAEDRVVDCGDDYAGYGIPANYGYVRPYAWTIRALALKYAQTENPVYEERLKLVTDYLLRLSGGNICSFVVDIQHESKEFDHPDTTSCMIMLSAFMEVIKAIDTSHPNYDFYMSLCKKWFNHIIDNYAVSADSCVQGLVTHGIMLLGIPLDKRTIINRCTVCGDFYFLEAIMQLYDGFVSYWNTDNF